MFKNDIYKYLAGDNLTEIQLDLFNDLSNIFIDFPVKIEPPSSAVVALACNSGASLAHALSSGLNCISDQHLPIQQIAEFIHKNHKYNPKEVVERYSNQKIPGFGHPSIKNEDDRVIFLKNKYKSVFGDSTNFCINLEKIMPVPMNIGCIIACLSLDNGIAPYNCLFLPLLGRMFGWLKIYNDTKVKFNKVVPSFLSVNNENL